MKSKMLLVRTFYELMQFILTIYILGHNVYITNKMKVRIGVSTAILCEAKELRVQVFYFWIPLFAFDLIYLRIGWDKAFLSLSVFVHLRLHHAHCLVLSLVEVPTAAGQSRVRTGARSSKPISCYSRINI